MIIHLVEFDGFDGECNYSRPIKAFTKKEDAEEHVRLCKEEVERIKSEVEAHWEEVKDESEELLQKVRQMILDKTPSKDVHNSPEYQRRYEIGMKERSIIQSHKYDKDFFSIDEPIDYIIVELELVTNEGKIQSSQEEKQTECHD